MTPVLVYTIHLGITLHYTWTVIIILLRFVWGVKEPWFVKGLKSLGLYGGIRRLVLWGSKSLGLYFGLYELKKPWFV